MTDRRAELAANLAAIRQRIEAACAAAGRDPAGVTLVVVTKFFPASDIELLAGLGVTDIGENRDQEAGPKVADLSPEVAGGVRVHFIGQLQTNKARSVARYADVVHSVDRARLVTALDKAAGAALDAGERTAYLEVLLQVDLEEGERAGRGGVLPGQVAELADRVAQAEHLRLRGVMAVAPPGLPENGTRAAFARLAQASRQVAEVVPEARLISAGMSGDLELAVAEGATHLRVGSAILGSRPAPR
ncbi:YggS family pyridoxal phosphate-dependent enzyme [Ornithinicoccus hortensis]|uniref:Pyridoxal phosphate homeostasis protein n=1 Tax=Ornithinicoccus hortensis TaxID=82346 RepID=A0A542YR23_9MICO|nr:YggS family pyridoxal phosphate-dependent enzyme [Ornithinicoccus hortensis]TQL50543.1 hypothetical protein FB467_1654 [Ornithinicoccus hortensis]